MRTNNESAARLEAARARFGYGVAAGLTQGSEQLAPEVAASLGRIRAQAVARRKRAEDAPAWVRLGNQAVLGARRGASGNWKARLAAALALPLLWLGLLALQHYQQERFVHRIADIDTALLLDDLPPQAYTDPGFRDYLRQGA